MDGTAVKEMRDAFAAPETLLLDGEPMLCLPDRWEARRRLLDLPQPLEFTRLRGVTDYLKSNVDNLDKAALMLHVVGPNAVRLYQRAEKAERWQRVVRAEAACDRSPFPEGSFMDMEAFIVRLQSMFADTPDRTELLALAGNVREVHEQAAEDDGAKQTVKVQHGITLVEKAPVKQPWMLAPWRTFPEVTQPTSAFILRFKSGGGDGTRAALFACDGGRWEVDAVQNIAEWLRNAQTDVPVLA